MFLTQCAVCATELGLTLGKKCGRCSTRYCGAECQKQHWEQGGHDQLCKPIKRAGGAEQYNANSRYTEAVAVAAEACAEDTAGQTCYICTQALHWKTREGLVRGCACRGTAGFAHVSCLAEQAKILVAEAEENNWDDNRFMPRWRRWDTCSMCGQDYHGVVACALGWACWKTYLGLPEVDQVRRLTFSVFGNALHAAEHYEDALSVEEAHLSMLRRLGDAEDIILTAQGHLAMTYAKLGRIEEASRMLQGAYSGHLKLNGEENADTLAAANNYATSLIRLKRFEEAKALLRRTIPVALRVIGESNDITLLIRVNYAKAIYKDGGATFDDVREAVETLEDTERTARRVLGGEHPIVRSIKNYLQEMRAALATREAQSPGDLCEALEAI